MFETMSSPADIALVCLDLSGTIVEGSAGPALPGAVDAVRRIAERLPVRFVTNVTSQPAARLVEHLRGLGLLDDPAMLYTPATTARRVLSGERGAGLLLADGPVREDLDWFREDPEGPSVLIATEGHDLRIRDLQPAFRRLLDGASLYALQRNRYFSREGELWTDVGPLATLLAYAADTEIQVFGKPSPLLFDAIADEAGTTRDRVVMVGDDAEFDVSASVGLGLRGVLVRTGKYRSGDESRLDPGPTAVLDSIAELPGWLGIGG
jgi:HAD superfamily hydrolase (TIGR01458 family)